MQPIDTSQPNIQMAKSQKFLISPSASRRRGTPTISSYSRIGPCPPGNAVNGSEHVGLFPGQTGKEV